MLPLTLARHLATMAFRGAEEGLTR